MTANDRDKPTIELEALYRAHGDVEPRADLDRIIRARADDATRRSAIRRAPWIGGLTTASVAVVAIAVVLQQPGDPTSGRHEMTESAAPAAGVNADPAPKPAPQAEPPSPARAPDANEAADRAGDAPAAGMDPRQAPASADRSRFADERAVQSTAELRSAPMLEAEALADDAGADALLTAIREAAASGDLSKARELAADYRQRYPARVLPEELARRLEDD